MTESVDCQVFSDQLERLVEGRLPDEAMRLLRIHADGCVACSTQLRVKRELSDPSIEGLEAQVPDPMVATMYERVQATLRTQAATAGRDPTPTAPAFVEPLGTRPAGRAWIPLLAAASLALLLSTGFLGIQLRRAQLRESRLAVQLEVQSARVAGLLTAGDRPSGPTGGASWLRLVPPQETITVAELMELLDRIPADRVIVSRARVGLLRSRPTSRAGRIMDSLLEEIPVEDGIRAGDLLRAIEEVRLRRDLTVPTADLVELLS